LGRRTSAHREVKTFFSICFQTTGEVHALKLFDKYNLQTQREMETLSKLQHPNIVKFYKCEKDVSIFLLFVQSSRWALVLRPKTSKVLFELSSILNFKMTQKHKFCKWPSNDHFLALLVSNFWSVIN
jgi:serine/threonine protein kinase